MLPYYDPTLNKSGIEQYLNFLHDQKYLKTLSKNVQDVTNYQILQLRKNISQSSKEKQAQIEHSIERVCGTLAMGFSAVNDKLISIDDQLVDLNSNLETLNGQVDNVISELIGLNSLLDYKTDLMLEQQRFSNDYLLQIQHNSLLTEEQKICIYNNKIGFAFLNQAIEKDENEEYYKKAKAAFEKAFDANEYDAYSAHSIGYILLNSISLFDKDRAEEYFMAASMNAEALGLEFKDNKLLEMAASAFFHLSICKYISNENLYAIDYIKSALEIRPKNSLYQFWLAKLYATITRTLESVEVLRPLCESNPRYSVNMLEDPDLSSKSDILKMLDLLTQEAVDTVNLQIEKIRSIMIDDSEHREELNKILEALNPQTYLSSKKVVARVNDLLENVRSEMANHDRKTAQLQYERTKLEEEKRLKDIKIKAINKKEKQERLAVIITLISAVGSLVALIAIPLIANDSFSILVHFILINVFAIATAYVINRRDINSSMEICPLIVGFFGIWLAYSQYALERNMGLSIFNAGLAFIVRGILYTVGCVAFSFIFCWVIIKIDEEM